jgi:hypothetical protein
MRFQLAYNCWPENVNAIVAQVSDARTETRYWLDLLTLRPAMSQKSSSAPLAKNPLITRDYSQNSGVSRFYPNPHIASRRARTRSRGAAGHGQSGRTVLRRHYG